MTPEAKVKKKVKDILNRLYMYHVMPIGSGYGNAGAPDFLACYRGRFIGIECKAKGNKPTALQLKNLEEIEQCGGYVFVVDETNVSDLSRKLMELFK
jgi:hypothetical protein